MLNSWCLLSGLNRKQRAGAVRSSKVFLGGIRLVVGLVCLKYALRTHGLHTTQDTQSEAEKLTPVGFLILIWEKVRFYTNFSTTAAGFLIFL